MERIESFDILKGITIILMIVAHTYGPNCVIWNFIYTFHMPLFFIVSGYFYKLKSLSEIIKKNCIQLLMPYLIICCIVTCLSQMRQQHNIFGDIESTLNGLGPGWFLLTMFWARIEFHFLLRYFPHQYFLLSLIISTTTCLFAYYYSITTILSFYPSLASLLFLTTGYYIKQHHLLEMIEKKTIVSIPIGLALWLITSTYGKVDLSVCIFKLSVIDFAGSFGGTYIFYIISQHISKYDITIKTILSYAGKYSLVILFFHSIDYCVPVWHYISPHIPQEILLHAILIIRLLYVAICVIITINSRWGRSFFCINR